MKTRLGVLVMYERDGTAFVPVASLAQEGPPRHGRQLLGC